MTYRFKTNINCGGCIAKITPFMEEESNIENWEVNTDDPKKVLSVETQTLNEIDIIAIVENAGFKAESLKKGFFKRLF